MTVADKILFTCSACQYRARIPGHYSGRSIHCPGCKTIQAVAAIEEAGAPHAAPIAVAKLDTPAVGHALLTTTPAAAPGANKIVFACTACSYKGRLAAEYDGKTIRCPGCQTAQVVKGTPAPAPIVASLAADETAFRGGDNEKIRFACSACGYRARIPGKYADKPIHCPQCKQIQVAKAETDLEDATGRTVSISRVTPAAVKEPRLAMTNVGVQFHCAVCGFESKISPSCAGDAIYCPSCRAPQKVEWGDPAAKALAPAAEIDAAPVAAPKPMFMAPTASAAAPAPAPAGALDDLPLPGFDLEPVAVAPVSTPQALGTFADVDVSDVFAVLPPAPDKPARSPSVVKKGSRRIVSAGGGAVDNHAAETTAPAPMAVAPVPVPAAATASAVVRPRRSVPAPAKVGGGEDSSSAHRPAASAVAAPAEPPSAAPIAAKASKLPLIVLALLVAVLIGFCVVLFLQVSDLKVKQAEAEVARKTSDTARQTAEQDAKDKGEQLAVQKALAEKAQQQADAALQDVEAAKVAAEAALKEIEALKAAAAVVAPGEAPAPAVTAPALPAP